MSLAKQPMLLCAPPDTFYTRYGKRAFDVTLASLGLVIISPLFAVCAILVKLTSAGPVFYAQKRVGRAGRVFEILKFRSMCVGADKMGPGITAKGDARITSIGQFMRNFKLDEIPQLWNVVKGDMSLVGPRPEIPLYVSTYDDSQRQVLNVLPGITDLASLVYRNEEELLAGAADHDRYYRDSLIPEKIALNMRYISSISLCNDLKLICQTLFAVPLRQRSIRRTNA